MEVELAYGRTGLRVRIDHPYVSVVRPRFVPGLPDEEEALEQALRRPIGAPPLSDLVRPTDRVAIVFCDITRPTPSDRILPVILRALQHVPRERIVLVNALGTHRPQTREELVRMLGASIVDSYRIEQSDSRRSELFVPAATLPDGTVVHLNRHVVEADVKILTGFVEPHFFAGFSGGPKLLYPGVAKGDDILYLHSAAMIGHPSATWGVTEGNPVFETFSAVARQVPGIFLVEVALNRHRQITGVFAGDLWAAHRAGMAFVRESAMQPVPELFDIVVTTGSGYPLDQNLYQSVKGMSAAARVVKPGGAIVLAAECSDGVPSHGNFGKLLGMGSSPDELLRLIHRPGFAMLDQWQVQILAMILQRADVFVKADGLSDEAIRAAHLTPIHDVAETVHRLIRERYGPQARVGILPEGPQTIPYLAPQPMRASAVPGEV
ncbi:MAG TPA: nickel-dependent lactate racemase [Limnochordales bacterium]